jgi:hypothetical protein
MFTTDAVRQQSSKSMEGRRGRCSVLDIGVHLFRGGEGAMGNAHTAVGATGIDSQVIKFLSVRAEWKKRLMAYIVLESKNLMANVMVHLGSIPQAKAFKSGQRAETATPKASLLCQHELHDQVFMRSAYENAVMARTMVEGRSVLDCV